MWSSQFLRPALAAGCLIAAPFLIRKEDPPVPPSPPAAAPAAFDEAIAKAYKLSVAFKERTGAPGVSVGVAIHDKVVWQTGLGFADVENGLPMTPHSVVRIASISKPICGLLAISLADQGKLDLQKNVRDYVPEFPEKKVDGQPVNITVTHVLSHTSGIRHYTRKEELERKEKERTAKEKEKEEGKEKAEGEGEKTKKKKKKKENGGEFGTAEYYIKDHYKTVFEALELFKDDDLLHAPGTTFSYTTHGYTLLSAVIERAGGSPFDQQFQGLLNRLELWDTHMEQNDDITVGRVRHYKRADGGRLSNVPYVDNSYKWAGGGLVSNIPDLLRFGNHLLAIHDDRCSPSDRLVSREMLEKAWTALPNTKCNWLGTKRDIDCGYGLAWAIFSHRDGHRYVAHTGGAIGATTAIVLMPEFHLSVVVLCNLQNASGVGFVGKRIADAFVEALMTKGLRGA